MAMVCGILERGLEALIDVVNDRGVSSEIEKVLGEGERERESVSGENKKGKGKEGLFEVCEKRPKRVAKSMKDALRDMEDVLKHDKNLSKGRSTSFY